MPLLLTALLLMLAAAPALANSWNLTGPLLDHVNHTHLYDDYTAYRSVDQSKKGVNTVAAFMGKRDRTLLLAGHKDPNGQWQVVECVYDISNADADEIPDLYCMDDELVLTNGWDERYVFHWLEDDELGEPDFYLIYAEIPASGLSASMDANGYYMANDNGTPIRWYTSQPITLAGFDPWLFPQSSDAIRTMNTVRYMADGYLYAYRIPVTLGLNEKLPVYSAPDETSYRAANGKAAVSLKDSYIPLAHTSEGWLLIEYTVSSMRHRIGWVKDPRLEYYSGYIDTEGVPVLLRPGCSLTDDPFYSNIALAPTDELTNVRLLCGDCLVPWYCYVTAERNGQAIGGFVPATAVQPYPGVLTGKLMDLSGITADHQFAVETDNVTYLETIEKPLFDLTGFITDDAGHTAAVTGSYSTIIEDDCLGPFGFGASYHTYALADDFVLRAPADVYDDITLNNAVYTDIEQFRCVLLGDDAAANPDYGFTCQIELNENGEICYMEYFYVPWG